MTGITVISAQVKDTEGASTQVCHIFPIRTPSNEIYPNSVDVLHSIDANMNGCESACDFCYQFIGDTCVDHYGCQCSDYHSTMKCKGKPARLS